MVLTNVSIGIKFKRLPIYDWRFDVVCETRNTKERKREPSAEFDIIAAEKAEKQLCNCKIL